MSGEDPSFHGLGSRLLVETQLVGEHAVREAGVSTGVEELMCGSSQAVFVGPAAQALALLEVELWGLVQWDRLRGTAGGV